MALHSRVPALVLVAVAAMAQATSQPPAVRSEDEGTLREYAGVYQWDPGAFVYLQLWDEFSGFGKPRQLVAFDESGDVRVLYATDRDRFFSGPGAAVNTSVESRVEFQRDAAGRIVSLSWQRGTGGARRAKRVEIERREDVRFSSAGAQLAGTLIEPATPGKHPAVILVHGSGAENRDYILPWARFLIRRGVAVLGYDKRGVGESTGDWNSATFDDLAGDVAAACDYLSKRDDIYADQIGLLGISQAGWVMPLAAVRAKGPAFIVSISGAGVPVDETTIDQARNEMTIAGMKPPAVEEVISLMKLQYQYARTGQGWDAYAAAREKLAARMGTPPDTIPGTPDHPYWGFIKRIYFYDPGPTLRRLQTPVLGIWGELDNNVVAQKNRDAWKAALEAGGHRDHAFVILPKANHALFEARVGNNAEGPTLQRIVPGYFTTVDQWLAGRLRGYKTGR